LWILRRFATLPPVRTAEEAVMQRVGVVVLLGGAVAAARPTHGASTR
jgi:hypothetical protein